MTSFDIFILAVYLICVASVFIKIREAFAQLVTIAVNTENLNKQLEVYELQDLVEIKFKFNNKYKSDPISELSLSLTNKSEKKWLYVYWMQSTVTNFEGKSQRVIRIIPGMPLDLFQEQAYSVIAAGETLDAKISVEDTLKRNEAGILEVTSPLFDAKTLSEALDKKQRFSLRLIIQLADPVIQMSQGTLYAVSCEFFIRPLPWKKAILWKSKKKKKKD